MRQFFIVFKHEYLNFIRNKSFIIVSVVAILGILAVTSIPRFQDIFSTGEDGDSSGTTKIVLVDNASEGESLAAMMESYFGDVDIEVANLDLEGVKKAIKNGEYDSGFIVNDVDSYQYIVDSQQLTDSNNEIMNQLMRVQYQSYLMQENGLTSTQANQILSAFVDSEVIEIGVNQSESFFFTYAMIMFLYMSILIYGQLIATSVATEKTSRAMEMLITSAKPRSLMFGKIFASGVAGLSQILVIILTGYIGYTVNADYIGAQSFVSLLNVSTSTLFFGILFFLLGFFLYAFLFGAVGSTVSKVEDISPAVMPITLLFVGGFIITMVSTTSGDVVSPAIMIGSFFPFFAPLAMLARIGMSVVPLYQIMISVGILILTTIIIGMLAAKIYRLGVMHYGNRMKLMDIFRAIKD